MKNIIIMPSIPHVIAAAALHHITTGHASINILCVYVVDVAASSKSWSHGSMIANCWWIWGFPSRGRARANVEWAPCMNSTRRLGYGLIDWLRCLGYCVWFWDDFGRSWYGVLGKGCGIASDGWVGCLLALQDGLFWESLSLLVEGIEY